MKSQKTQESSSATEVKVEASTKRALLGDFALEDAHLYRMLRGTFMIYMGNEATEILGEGAQSDEPAVEHNMATRFEINLHILSNIDPTRPILIIQSSDGGYWESGMQIFSAILACPNPITLLAVRDARSMTSIIPLAADRFLLRPSAKYMFHHGTWSFDGLVQEGITDFWELLCTREIMFRIYIARLKERGKYKDMEEESLRKKLEQAIQKRTDVWIEAPVAQRLGFVDKVINGILTRNHLATARNEKRRKIMTKVLLKPIKRTEMINRLAETIGDDF